MLAASTGLSERDLNHIVSNAPARYKTYTIPKRRGGYRIISQPAKEVKALQKVLVERVLSQLPVHTSATAYRVGISIRDNALMHVGEGPILKFDFEEFFPSIKARDWVLYCEENSLFDDPLDIFISTKILFHRPKGSKVLRLAIGAPSSPTLSNILMHNFDSLISKSVTEYSVKYSRYADDLTFSAKRMGFLKDVRRTLNRVIHDLKSPTLRINDGKTVQTTRKYNRTVTGLVLTNDGKISVGHERKRAIRAALHHALHDDLNLEQMAYLTGLLAFAQSIEPDFVDRMIAKYGIGLISRVRGVRLPSRVDESQNETSGLDE